MAQFGDSSLYLKRDQEAVDLPHSGTVAIATGTFIGIGSDGNAYPAVANSGNSALPAVGFALVGANKGTWTVTRQPRFDAIDNPFGVGQVNSGSYTPGLPLYLSGSGLVNFSTTPPTNSGDIVQQIGVMITSTSFRVRIGAPYRRDASDGELLPYVVGALNP